MSGFSVISKPKVEHCPYCHSACTAEFTKVGDHEYVQVSPYECSQCGSFELVSIFERNPDYPITSDEIKKGWYKPHTSPKDVYLMSNEEK